LQIAVDVIIAQFRFANCNNENNYICVSPIGFAYRYRFFEIRRSFLRTAQFRERLRCHGIESTHGREAVEHHRRS